MKIQSTKKNEKSKRKVKKNSNKKKHVKVQRSRIFQETKFDSSSDESSIDFKEASNETIKLSISTHSIFENSLTPSKSEDDSSGVLLCETDENNVSCKLAEESIDISSGESDSFCYNNVVEEFINEDVDGDNATIVSSPISKNLNKISQEEKTRQHIEPKKYECDTNHCDEEITLEDANCYYTNDGIIVILEKNQTIYFHGLMLLSVLHGEIEVLGYTLTKNSGDVKLYSPRGSSLLYMKNITTSDVAVTNYLMNLNILNKIKLSKKCAIALCKKLEDTSISFIEKHVSQQILPKSDHSNLPRVVFQPKGSWNLLKPNLDWDSLINQIEQSNKMMICGGKSVGKTTFLRYAINKLLMKFKEIRIIDLDPGQSEFTIPGCISIVKINKPIFGVNYTHLETTERSILSNVNIGYEPEKYISSVKSLLNVDFDETPTLINCMGYTHGIGINILSAVIVHTEPTDVLQIVSHNSKKNYKSTLSLDVVRNNARLFIHSNLPNFDYKVHEIYSMCDENDGWTAEPRQLREMSILGYISQMLDSNSIFRTKSAMFKIDLLAVSITNLKGEIIHPAAINASLVALCSLEEESVHIFKCIGWGIVRGIDIASNTLILLTRENSQRLEQVSHVVLNSATLPPSLYMTPDKITGQIPYVIEGDLMSLGQIPKRSRISVRGKV